MMKEQFLYILSLVVAGAAMGTVFDIYNTVTGASKWFRWIRPTLDLLFWIGSAAVVYYLLYKTDSGRIRLYLFSLLLVGYLLYRWMFGQSVVRSAFVIVRWVEGLVRVVYKVVYNLTFRPLWWMMNGFVRIGVGLYRVLCVLEDGVFWLVRFWLKVLMVYWLFRIPRVQRGARKLRAGWEEMWTHASKWLKTILARV